MKFWYEWSTMEDINTQSLIYNICLHILYNKFLILKKVVYNIR